MVSYRVGLLQWKDEMKGGRSYVYDVDEGDFEQRVIEASRERPVLVDFWAEWCSPCIALAPALERAVDHYRGELSLAKLEVDDNMRLAGHYRLRGFPTVILFRCGEELGRFGGAHPAHWIQEWLEKHWDRDSTCQ